MRLGIGCPHVDVLLSRGDSVMSYVHPRCHSDVWMRSTRLCRRSGAALPLDQGKQAAPFGRPADVTRRMPAHSLVDASKRGAPGALAVDRFGRGACRARSRFLLVPALSQLLERLRRMRPPPGAAAAAIGVPSRGEELLGEVEFLFERLDAVEDERDRAIAAAQAAAREIEAAAQERGRLLLDQARAAAAATAAELQAQRAAACERQAQALLADAQREAARVLAQGRTRIPAFTETVVGRILEQAP